MGRDGNGEEEVVATVETEIDPSDQEAGPGLNNVGKVVEKGAEEGVKEEGGHEEVFYFEGDGAAEEDD